jgi:ABC-type amino acid transport substrate-binding protein
MDFFTKILEQFGAFFRLQDQLSSLSSSNPVVAWLVILVMAMFIANIAITQVVEFKNKFSGQWRHSRLAWAGLIAGFCMAGLVSAGVVLNLQQATAAVPAFDKDSETIVGRPLVLKWDYKVKKNARFEVQSSKDRAFKEVMKYIRNGNYLPAGHINDKRYWRVREIDTNNREVSSWSKATEITQYETSLKQILETGNIRVLTSISVNTAFFMFDVNGGPRGFEVDLLNEIVAELPSLIGSDKPLTYTLVPVDWEELLEAPDKGRADMIISTISSLPKREKDFVIKFSTPYFCTTQSLIYRPSQSSESVLELIENKKVGVQKKTTSQEMMVMFKADLPEARKFELKDEYPQAGDVVESFANHSIEVGLTDTPFARAAQLQYGSDKLAVKELLKEEDFPKGMDPERRVERYAVAVRTDEKILIGAIDSIIKKMREKKLVEFLESAVVEYYAAQGGSRNIPLFDRKADPSECKRG